MDISLKSIAHILGGDLRGNQVLAPGPGHSREDRSLSITISDSGDDIVVHSFAHDDPITCKDYVREKCGIQIKPNGKQRFSQDVITRAVMAAAEARAPRSKPVATYPYADADGKLLYEVLRYQPKHFQHRQRDGRGGWIYKGTHKRVLYRLPELIAFPDATVFICEGEKDADNVAALDLCATTVASGKWTDDCVNALAGRDCWILEDNDDSGRTKALEAARLLHPVAKSVKTIKLPGLADSGDISDWLDMGHSKEELIDICFDVPLWEPQKEEAAKPENKPIREPAINGWDDPDWSLLDTQRGNLPDFPLDVLSSQLQQVIERSSRGAGVTPAHVAVPLLGISSGLIGYSRRIKATASWVQPGHVLDGTRRLFRHRQDTRSQCDAASSERGRAVTQER